jgi:type I restriction enzyme, S subunit
MDSHLLRIQLNRRLVDPQFVTAMIAAQEVVGQQIVRISHGSIMSGLSSAIVRKLRIPLPSLAAQRRIAEIIDTVDAVIQQTEALIAKLKQIKAGLLHDLLTRGLDEHSELRDPVANPEQFQDTILGRIPVEWEIAALGRVLTGIDAGKSPDCPDKPAASGEWRVLKVSAVRPEGFRAEENKVVTNSAYWNAAYEVRDGDLLMSRANTYELVGLTCLVRKPPPRLLLCDKTLRLNLDTRHASVEFIFNVIQMPFVRSQIEVNATGTSGSMKNISQDVINRLLVPLPPLDEQNHIAAILSADNDLISTEEAYRDKLKLVKKGLMDDLLTGRVRVNALEEVAV